MQSENIIKCHTVLKTWTAFESKEKTLNNVVAQWSVVAVSSVFVVIMITIWSMLLLFGRASLFFACGVS